MVTINTDTAAIDGVPNQLRDANFSKPIFLANIGIPCMKIKLHTNETIIPLIILGIKNPAMIVLWQKFLPVKNMQP